MYNNILLKIIHRLLDAGGVRNTYKHHFIKGAFQTYLTLFSSIGLEVMIKKQFKLTFNFNHSNLFFKLSRNILWFLFTVDFANKIQLLSFFKIGLQANIRVKL